jgi:protein gp37
VWKAVALMAENTSIEWCDHTWTLVVGCDPVSPACAKCYAALMASRLEAMGKPKYVGLATRVGNIGKWTGEVRFDEAVLDLPLRTRRPGRWFLTSMGDIGHEKVTDGQIASAFEVMQRAHWHTFLVLTKRTARFAERLPFNEPLRNVFIGCTAENQAQADEHRQHMRSIAAAGWRTFVSYEPALGQVNWTGWEFLQQLISGGESGHDARPSHQEWHRAARDFAARHGIAYLFKQWGAWLPSGQQPGGGQERWKHTYSGSGGIEARNYGKKAAGRLLDGVEHNGFPDDAALMG